MVTMLTRIRDVEARSEAWRDTCQMAGWAGGEGGCAAYLARLLLESGQLLDGGLDVCLIGY